MSSRALRKAQKEREEAALQERLAQQGDSSDDDVDLPVTKSQPSAFALLGEENVDDDDDNGDDTNEEIENGLDAPDVPTAVTDINDDQAAQPVTSTVKRNKKKKKSKKKQNPAGDQQKTDPAVDEIDAALASLKSASARTEQGSAALDSSTQQELEACELLGVQSQNLQVLTEIRRAFGKDFVDGDQQERNDFMEAVRRRAMARSEIGLADLVTGLHSKDGEGLSEALIRRNIFVRGRKEWPKATATGLAMEIVEQHDSGITEFAFVHNANYRGIHNEFITCVHMGEPMALVNLLRHHPYHITTLLQVATFAKYQGDGAVAGELLERALFSFGRALSTSFQQAIAHGRARMDFARPANREFFLTARRYLANLNQRGTRRTEYEWAKLLLSLSPKADPYCMRLCLDRLAIRCHNEQHYLQLSGMPFFKDLWRSIPHSHYSRAIALLPTSPAQAAKELESAISQFPATALELASALELSTPTFEYTEKIKNSLLLARLYASMSKELFQADEVKQLFKQTLLKVTSNEQLAPVKATLTTEELRDLARDALVSDNRAMLELLPSEAKADPGDEFDPLPPLNSVLNMVRMGNLQAEFEDDNPNPNANYQRLEVSFSDDVMKYQEIPTRILRADLPRCFIAELARLQDFMNELIPVTLSREEYDSNITQSAKVFPGDRIGQPIPGSFTDDADSSTQRLADRIPVLQVTEQWTQAFADAEVNEHGTDRDVVRETIEKRYNRFRDLLTELNGLPDRKIEDVTGSTARLVPGRNVAVINFNAVEAEEGRLPQVIAGTMSNLMGRSADDFEDVQGCRWLARWGVNDDGAGAGAGAADAPVES